MKVKIRFEKQEFDPKEPDEYVEFEVGDGEVVSMIEVDYQQRCNAAEHPENVARRSVEEIFREEINKPEYNNAKQWVRNTASGWRSVSSGGGSVFDELIDQYGHGDVLSDPFEAVDGCLVIVNAIEGLDERERFVLIENRFKKVTLSEIGAVLGVTRERVSQLLRSARTKVAAEIGFDF